MAADRPPHRNAKIIATIGPATASEKAIRALWEAGANVFRLNFSHGSHEDHRGAHTALRALEQESGRPVSILADLQGPKFRIGEIAGGKVKINPGDRFTLDLDEAPGNLRRAPLPHAELFRALRPGQDMLIDDGRLRLRVIECGEGTTTTEVVAGGKLSSRKGVSLPGVVIPVSPLTDKDRRDLDFALGLGVDWVALSFVQRPDDLAELRKAVQGRAGILAKLEKPAAIDRLDEILDLSDAVMVARGDLGVEMPPEDVPILQKRIVAASRRAGKPVVVATQMLESMVSAATPTRAEATDVANAVYEGADAVMLSAETAAGNYPTEAVAMMDRIIRRVEQAENFRLLLDAVPPEPQATAADAITAAARQVAETISAAAIVTYTTSGSTALRAARERPTAPILCLTGSNATARRLVLAWGVECFFTHDASSVEEMVEHAVTMTRERGFGKKGDAVVITAGMPFGTPGATNMLRIAWVD